MPDASAIASEVRSGRATARSAVEAALARIDRDRTNAVVTVCATEACADVDRVDAAIARGADAGPLAGVPFTVKDTLAAAGLRATVGSLVLADHVARADAEVVDRLRAAGAVLVGKTNCPEFALQAWTDNRIFGPTRHPRDPERSPGGSSGGCAAAVAGGLVPFSIGGDYGGSIRYPAACTGIFGLRPTYLAVPVRGHVPEPAPGSPRARFQTVGPLARTLRDVALVFDALAGAPAPGATPAVARRPRTAASGSCGAGGPSCRPSPARSTRSRACSRTQVATWSTSIPLRLPPRRMSSTPGAPPTTTPISAHWSWAARPSSRRTSHGCSRPCRCPPTCRRRSRR